VQVRVDDCDARRIKGRQATEAEALGRQITAEATKSAYRTWRPVNKSTATKTTEAATNTPPKTTKAA
jgi:hypothetical protein